MRFTNRVLMLWLLDRIADLGQEMIKVLKEDKEYTYPESKITISLADSAYMCHLLNKWFGYIEVECSLLKLQKKMEGPHNLQHFFYRAHLLGHYLIAKHYPEYDINDNHDAAFVEIVSLFFASTLCHLFFKLDELSEIMINELAASLEDLNTINLRTKMEKYTAKELLIGCDFLLTEFLIRMDKRNTIH